MIARVWQGLAKRGQAGAYAEHLRRSVRPELEALAGFRGLYLLRRDSPAGVEVEVITFWESLAAISAFAGEDPEAAVVAPAAQEMFHRYDSRVRHYEVALGPEDAGPGG